MLDAWGIPALPVLEVARDVVLARAAQAEGDRRRRDRALDEGRRHRGHHPLYGAAVLVLSGEAVAGRRPAQDRQGRGGREGVRGGAAEGANSSAWALYGMQEAAKARGDGAGAEKAGAALAKSWRGDPAMLNLERL